MGDRPVPVALEGGRIGSLDFIRGIAVMGILAANIVAFGQPFGAYVWPGAFLTPHDGASDWLWAAQLVLVDGKMRGLFTLLFGAGLYLFMEKAWAKGATRWLQARRLFWLLLFGAAHYFLVWRGDILMIYACAGFIAILCLRWSAKTQMIVGVTGYLLGALAYLGMFGTPYLVAETSFGDRPEFADMKAELAEGKAEALVDDAAEVEILTQGSYADFVAHNVSAHGGEPLFNIVLFGFETLPLILIGMALYRWGMFDGRIVRRKQLVWGIAGLVVGFMLTIPIALWAKENGLTYWGTIGAMLSFTHLPRLPVVIGLAAILAVIGGQASGWLAERISAAGRAAFSNYLGTSMAMMLVFHPWAGGLFGVLDRPHLYLVVILAWVAMLAWSKPWLDHFRYGPLEWLWRCLTYGRRFAFRR